MGSAGQVLNFEEDKCEEDDFKQGDVKSGVEYHHLDIQESPTYKKTV